MGFSLIRNHGFIDGNKRIAHAAMETLLVSNGMELRAPVDEQERFMASLAAGLVSREGLAEWLGKHAVSLDA